MWKQWSSACVFFMVLLIDIENIGLIGTQCKNNPTTLLVRKGKPRVTKKYEVRKMTKIYVLGAIKKQFKSNIL